jgi:transposase
LLFLIQQVDWEEFKKISAIERFFTWIESCKKAFPKYEIKEISSLGVITLATIIKLNQVFG